MEHDAVQHAVQSGSKIQDLAWLVLFLPLLGSVMAWFITRRDRVLTTVFTLGTVILSFILSVTLFAVFGAASAECTPFQFLHIGDLKVDIGLHLDALSTLMLLVVTGVASLVMIFSTSYMHDDASYSRFFCTLGLFVFSMLGIVLANNFVMMFVFWELVGVSSYLLIGFWFERPAAGDAAKKAFLSNRLGDFGFILGILMVWSAVGSVNFQEIQASLIKNPAAMGVWAGLAGLLVFMGAMGKSAQFPLHVWLPDAMEGPTPGSALIHAATMVAAGVYMLCRVFFIYTVPAGWPPALSFLGDLSAATVVAWIGGITALLAALTAVQQNDIKRILAYSTLSQLGYMVMAVGLGASTGNPSASMFHLFTHAFFKAMLFLGAGSVIHACHHEQDIWRMGGLWKKMPVTFWTFAIGTAALAGLPPFSGFYSKDEILATALEANPILCGLAVLVACLTTFYMCRLVLVAFFGTTRTESAEHAHESPRSMTIPLMFLAVPSVVAGWFPVGEFIAGHFGVRSHEGVGRVVAQEGIGPMLTMILGGIDHALFAPFNHNALAAFLGLFGVLLGGSAAWALYWNQARDPLPGLFTNLSRAMRKKFYFDEIYDSVFIPIHDTVACIMAWFDRWIIDGLGVRGIHGTIEIVGRALRLVQTGNLQTYAFLFAAGVAFLAFIALQ